jgi:hypothetical protein
MTNTTITILVTLAVFGNLGMGYLWGFISGYSKAVRDYNANLKASLGQ